MLFFQDRVPGLLLRQSPGHDDLKLHELSGVFREPCRLGRRDVQASGPVGQAGADGLVAQHVLQGELSLPVHCLQRHVAVLGLQIAERVADVEVPAHKVAELADGETGVCHHGLLDPRQIVWLGQELLQGDALGCVHARRLAKLRRIIQRKLSLDW